MKQFLVIGLGTFGASVARSLAERGHNVLAIDKDMERVQSIAADLTHAVEADATDPEVLRRFGAENFDVAIVSIGDSSHADVIITMILKELGVPYVIVKARDDLHGRLLKKVGADRVVYPERDMGIRVANNLLSSNIIDYLEFSPDYSIIELPVRDNIIGKNLRELKLRNRYNVNVIAVKRGDEIYISGLADLSFEPGDIMIAFGGNDELQKMEKEL
ncbi:MAG: TrkA family potassium uptake protein [Halanaerobiaceae bacterium]|nr:TrkA family potassium uptake protein [Halanaerobiaceae bacterium]